MVGIGGAARYSRRLSASLWPRPPPLLLVWRPGAVQAADWDRLCACYSTAITHGRIAMFFFQEGFTYRNFLMDMLAVFAFVVWF